MPANRLTPAERSQVARLGAHQSWANTTDPSARTEPARIAANDRFEREVDPDRTLPPAERERRAAHARKAYFTRLALKSAQARRRRSGAPPGIEPAPASGGSESTEKLLKAAHLILDNAGIRLSPSKVSRLVRDYQRNVAPNGHSFLVFLATAVQLSEEQQRVALLNPDIARVISYSDPTGEQAVNNTLRAGGV